LYIQTIGSLPSRYLGSTPNRKVDGAQVSDTWQEWRLIMAGSNTYFIQSIAHGMFLGSTPTCKVDTTDVSLGWQLWKLVNIGGKKYLLMSVIHLTWI